MNKILIANRGEIAVRIIRACKEMNIKTVAIYSEADKDALHTRLADEAICVGPAVPAKSYLNIRNILEALNITKADSIHPGFGFLAENSHFAKICEESNIKFIGPKSDVINLLGNKSNAKKMMKKAGIPVIPGSDGSIKNIEDATKIAETIGYPVILKAAAGGGGKGIRIANDEEYKVKIAQINEEGKKRTIIFELNQMPEDLINHRKIIVDVIWWDESGLKVPKQALIKENGLYYVTRNKVGIQTKILVKVEIQNDKFAIIEPYKKDELKELGWTSDQIKKYKKITNYDEIIINQ